MKDTNILYPIKEEFTLKKLKLIHSPESDFMRLQIYNFIPTALRLLWLCLSGQKKSTTCAHTAIGPLCIGNNFLQQWQHKAICISYLLYRWTIATLFTFYVIHMTIYIFSRSRTTNCFIYLFGWCVLLCMFTHLFGAILATNWYLHPTDLISEEEDDTSTREDDTSILPYSIKIYWVLHTISLNLAFATAAFYSVFAYKLELRREIVLWNNREITGCPSGFYGFAKWSLEFHTILATSMLIDLMIVRFPIRILHMIFPLCLCIIYGIFTLIYYYAGGFILDCQKYIYVNLDWSKPGLATATVCLIILLVIIFGFVSFLLYKLREFIYHKCNKLLNV